MKSINKTFIQLLPISQKSRFSSGEKFKFVEDFVILRKIYLYFPKKKKTAIEKFFDTFLWNAINQRNSDATFSTFQGQCQKQVI